MITKIDYTTIYHVWSKHLWINRTSPIEQTSAMVYLGGYHLDNMTSNPTFLGYILDDRIVGVNSGHKCHDGGYRSRGLFVFPEHRKKGLGIKLLEETIAQAETEGCSYVWSYPKLSSWETYKKAGFSLASPWEISELGYNAYCIKTL